MESELGGLQGLVYVGLRPAIGLSSGLNDAGRRGKAEESEVLDGVGELANIVMGNVKDVLEEGGKEVGITPPTVIHGDNMIVRSRAKQEWLAVPFSTYNARFEVRIVLKD